MLWRDDDPKLFGDTVLVAAEQLGVQPLAVEKDYWVCETLRSIVAGHPSEIVFKGGTSLEKLRIIRRFSEDLDLLVIGTYASNRAQERALKAILATAATSIGVEPDNVKSGGKPGSFHRAGYLSPPLEHRANAGAIADPNAVLVELGQSGGPNPHDDHPVRSLLSQQLSEGGFDTSPWSDLAPFTVPILHPGRTLIEKLLRVNNFAQSPDSDPDPHGWPRIGRQLYDIYALLNDERVRELLADKTLAAEIVVSAREVSQAFGRPDAPVPDEGFSMCDALRPDSRFAHRLRTEHEAAMQHLYYGTETPPTFDEIMAEINDDADLLRI